MSPDRQRGPAPVIAVASGKGGTGKTTVALSLASVYRTPVQLLDCDVEEPDTHLFLRGCTGPGEVITIPCPRVDEERCDGCGACGRLCAYSAIVAVGPQAMVFPELCHGCGGCSRVCPQDAITEIQRRIGVIETLDAGHIHLVQGRLDVGVALAPPLIRAVQARLDPDRPAIIDSPPGTACPVTTTIGAAGFVLLVTEPTPFGLHDLTLMVDLVRQLELPCGVVVNRTGVGNAGVQQFCEHEGIPVLLELPEDRRIAEAQSRGLLLVEALPEYRRDFEGLLQTVLAPGDSPLASAPAGGVLRVRPGLGPAGPEVPVESPADPGPRVESGTAPLREIVVLSGKGGTGKTTVAASLAVLASRAVIADCDVDAADLHLLLSPRVLERQEFWSGREAVIRPADCLGCRTCLEVCRFQAIHLVDGMEAEGCCRIDPHACEGCGVCVHFCPTEAIDFPERLGGEWMVSRTRCGLLVHARLGAGVESSGKLVATVRRRARELATEDACPLVICDGPPGIGCPVIAAVTGASLVLVVTEPGVAGEHDLHRVLALTGHFRIPTAVCVNRWDINPEMTTRIEEQARRRGALVVGRIRYDPGITTAQMAGLTVIESGTPAAADLRSIQAQLEACADPARLSEPASA